MKKFISLLALMLFGLTSKASLSLVEMKVEGLRNPLGIDVAQPHFSWMLQSDENGCQQKSYQITVADATGSTVWESGNVESAAQFGIKYDGQPLQSRSAYTWTVTVTDNKGHEAESSAVFETAFLSANEWSAKWIHAAPAISYQTLQPLVIAFEAPITCRYIRLNVSELGLRANGDAGYSFVQLSEVEIYSGDNNLARNARFTVGKSADNWELPNYGWSLAYVNDGKTSGTLGWTTTQNPSTPVVLTADLKSVQTVDRILLYPRQDDHATGQPNNIAANFPAAFTIQTSSDNRSYDVAYSQSAPAKESLPYFAKTFTLESGKSVKRARIYASALGVFTMNLNGEAVTSAVLEPGESEYEKTLLYSTYDVTSLLHSGNNSLVAQVAGGIYDIDYLEGRFSKGEVRNNGKTALIAELHIDYSDGTSQTIITDDSWRTTGSPTLGSNWWGGEDYDARLRIGRLDNLQFDDSDQTRSNGEMVKWSNCEILDKPAFSSPHSGVSGSGRLKSRMYEPLQVVEEWKAVSVKTIQSGGYTLRMIDFGRNFAGTYRFRLKGRAGQQISLRSGENINPDGSVMMENFYTGPSDTYDVYTFAGDKDGEQWGPEFMYHGFRYLQIIGLDEEPSPGDFTAMRIRSDLDLIGSVETSNQLINDIHVICRDAIASQLYNSITDCPHREKLGWLDVPNEMYVSLNMNFGMENFYKKVVMDCFDAQQANGWVPSVCPFYMNVYGDDTNWGGAAILVPYRGWKYYGDKSLMETYYTRMKRLVQHFRNNTTGNLINNSYSVLSDWGQQTAGVNPLVPTEFTETTTYYYILKAMAEMAEELGNTSDASTYRTLAAAVKRAFNAKFYNAETGVYTSVAGGGGRQSEQAQPLYYGLVPEGDEPKVAAVLAEAVRRDGYKIKTGEIALKCVFMSLAQYGYNDIVWQMANQTDCPSYGYWVREGYTTTPEYWDVGIESQNHCMMDHIEEWFFTCLAGIQNNGTAFDHIILKPYIPADLQQLAVKTACAYGQIGVEWKRTGEAIDYQFTVPAGTQATIIVDVPDGQYLIEGTQTVTTATEGVNQVTYANHLATVEVGSGTYHFTTGIPTAINVPQAQTKPLTTENTQAYALSGIKATSSHHGVVIKQGSKQLILK
ncbi:MAG: family 78 glycoside hydrolase catalytic domain [Prevotella sp.]|nr:family 78 glycoside hydrolase catalytic domain [Prevotella sp.]